VEVRIKWIKYKKWGENDEQIQPNDIPLLLLPVFLKTCKEKKNGRKRKEVRLRE